MPTPDEDFTAEVLKKLTGQKLRKELISRGIPNKEGPPKGTSKKDMLNMLKQYLKDLEEAKQRKLDEEERLKEEARRLEAMRNGQEYIPEAQLKLVNLS